MTGAGAIAAAVNAGAVPAVDVVAAALARLEARRDLNAVITLCADEALARARAGVRGRLAGVPLLVKDVIDTAGVRTTYGSAIYRDHVPARSAPRRARARGRGGDRGRQGQRRRVRLGGVRPERPLRRSRQPGRAGSDRRRLELRQRVRAGRGPRAARARHRHRRVGAHAGRGLRGGRLQPGLGAIPLEGVFPLVPSFDTVGPMARTVADCALAYAALTGGETPRPRVAGLRVGVLTAPPALAPAGGDEPGAASAGALAVADGLREQGAHVREVRLPVPDGDTWAVFYGEAARSHAETFPRRRDEYGPDIRAKLDHAITVSREAAEAGRRALAAWRIQAARRPDVDLILSPTSGSPSCRRRASTSSRCGSRSPPTRGRSATSAGRRSRSARSSSRAATQRR